MPKSCKNLALIADMDATTALLMKEILREVACESLIVRDGRKVADKAIEKKPDIIIIDIILSGTNGLSVCRALRAQKETANIPILVFSLLDLPERSLAAGADAFLKKPLARSAFIGKVLELVHREEEGAKG